jgi:EAL domain-containing protein (putative c-di-GMP-specific phosphodiesterase class I)
MRNPEQAAALMEELRRLGVRLAMDDFGIGYSSIGHLKRFPIDSLKLDRTFVRDLPEDANDVAITRAVIAMAHALSIRVIAEGVERQAQLDLLRAEGCDEFQGYLCQPPLTEAELLRFMRSTGAFAASGAGRVPVPPPRVPRRAEDRPPSIVRLVRAGEAETVVPFPRGR